MRLEALEDRRLMAVGPELVAVQANSGSLLRNGAVENVAPRELTFRFDEGQIIDPASLAAITITRQSDDQVIQPGFVGIGETPNEVVVRFAETLQDDVYEIDIGAGGVELRNTSGDVYENVGRVTTPFSFALNLGAQVVAVVPQPVTRGPDGVLTQARNQIVVYFNDDDLHTAAISSDFPGVKPTVVDPQFYQLLFTNDTLNPEDGGPAGGSQGTVFHPTRIDYDPATDTAVLTFASAIDQLPTGPGAYRLRIGTNEVLPAVPMTVNASVGVRSDFNTNQQVQILLTPDVSIGEGNEIAVNVTRAALPVGADPNNAASYAPSISASGRTVNVTLFSANLNDANARGTTAAQLVVALNSHPQASMLLTAVIAAGGQQTNLANRAINYSPILLTDPGSRFTTATDVAEFGFTFDPADDNRAKSIVISSAIDKQFFPLNFPGAHDEPGHRDIPVQGHVSTPLFFSPSNTSSVAAGTDVADRFAGITTIPYNFRDEYGFNPVSRLPFVNVISEVQKQRAREIFEIYGDLLGVQFVETDDQGIIVATGDLRALGGVSQPGGAAGGAGQNNLDGQLTVVLDNAETWSDEFGVNVGPGETSWFEIAMREIGHALGLGDSHDLPPLTVQGDEGQLGQSSTGVPFEREDNSLPGDHDIIHGQHLYRPDSKDIDLYRFRVNEFGRFSAEAFAERLTVASHLDTVISLYRENGDGTHTLISRNDDYYSKDSFVEMDLTPGVYYVAVSASGNINFDPENGDTGIGGTTDGQYDLRLNFRPQADAAIVDIDMAGELPDRQPLDGDGDGVPGGVFNYWFQAGPTIFVDKAKLRTTSTAAVNVLTNIIPVADASIFPAAPFDIQIDNEDLRVTAVDLVNNRLTVLRGVNGTLPTAHAVGATVIAVGNGSLTNPYISIPRALAGVQPSTQIVRLVGNDGLANNPAAPLNQRVPYVLGRDPLTGRPLADGADLEVPQGVTLMIDEGAVFKTRRSNIVVGSSLPTIDRSQAAIQVLGTPGNNVIFTSFNDEQIGLDTNPNVIQTAAPGDWGGIVIRNDVDREAAVGRFDYERQGIFLNYINQADFRYGGGSTTLGSIEQVVAPIHLIDARPTITFNTITRSADAAMSANPDSFEESNFHDPAAQRLAYDPNIGDRPFTVDYRRIGPDIHGNRLVLQEVDPTNPANVTIHQNTLNGLFIRIGTESGQGTERLTVAGRFDDNDIVHILQENLEIQGTPGGLIVENYLEAPAPIPVARLAGGTLPAGTYNYFVTFIDADGVEGPRSGISNNSVITGGPGQGTIRLQVLAPPSGEFVSYRIYRSDATGSGPYTLVTQQRVTVTSYDDNGSAIGGAYTGAAPEPQIETTLPGGALLDGTFNYFVTFIDLNGVEGPASPLSDNVVINPGTPNRTVRLGIAAPPLGEFLAWRIYRSQPTGSGPYVRVAERAANTLTYDDDGDFNDAGEIPGLVFRGSRVQVERSRLDARLKIDPNIIVKTEGARIEATVGAQVIAEGRDGQEIIFTSLNDNRYGAGGTFDSASGLANPQPGDWGGIYIAQTGSASFDHALFAYGGGATRIEGGFGNFNVLEIHQADARVTNSTFEFNGDGTRIFDAVDDPARVGRGRNAPGVIFIRAAQPVIVNNVIRNNDATEAAINPSITINVNALNSDLVTDWGRTTGEIDLFNEMLDNQGPLLRGNILVNNPTSTTGINGLLVRGNVLTTAGVWDDTDIVHVLLNEVLVPDFHTRGGLRLESSANESLVVKLSGEDAGFTANGRPLDIDDRIGGSLHIVGQPGNPVVLTSLADDSIGAGRTLSGGAQFDTDNNGARGSGSLPSVGEVNNGTFIDNDAPVNAVGYFGVQPGPGGNITFINNNEVTVQGVSGALLQQQNFIFDFLNFIDIGPNGGAIDLSTTTITMPPTLISPDLVASEGTFPGPNGTVNWRVETRLDNGQPTVFNSVTLTSSAPLGDIRFISYLDEDVLGFTDDILYLTGTPGQPDFRAFTLDGPERVGFAHGGVYLPGAGLVNATYEGWAADQFNDLLLAIGGAGTTYTIAGNIDLADLPAFNDPALGQVFGPNDVTTAFTWRVDPTATSATMTSFLELVAEDPAGGQAGDWRGISLQQYANDRNVALVTEREANNAIAPGLNALPENAEFLGELAPNEFAGDDVRRLGYEIHGFLSSRSDIDVYSFRAQTGTEVWFDIDNTTHSLDTVLELVDANGLVIARSDNSLDESADPSLLFHNPSRISRSHVNPLAKSAFGIDDHFSTNPRDAGMRVVLPGSANTVGTYHIRVRSANPNLNTPNDQILGGESMGRYQLQIRLREMDEVPGTTIQYSDIRFATTAIDIQGLPLHSPLVGEFAESNSPNQFRANAQNLGNLLQTDRGAISVAGFLNSPNPEDPVLNNLDPDDVDWYTFTIDYDSLGFATNRGAGIVFDLDYADNLGRPNIRLSVFDAQGRLILSSDDSSISDDISAPVGGTGSRDLERGSGGPLDAFLGPIQLPAGQYFVAVSHAADVPTELTSISAVNPVNPLARVEPLESVVRISEDHISFMGGSTQQPQKPLTPLFVDGNGNFVGTLTPFNLSDVGLFVGQDTGAQQTTLHLVDAFNGDRENIVGRFGFATGDLAMRGDGNLFSFSLDRSGADAPNDADSGNFLLIDTGNGSAVVLRDDDINTFELDNNNNAVATHLVNNQRVGHGIQFNAMAFNRNASRLFAVGNRSATPHPLGSASSTFYTPGADYTQNILYRFDPSDFDGDGVAPGTPDSPTRAGNARVGRAGTDVLDQGRIPTELDLGGTGSQSVLLLPDATSVAGGQTVFVVNDGDFFVVQVQDFNGNPVATHRFEMNSGPEATIDFNLANNEFFVDGESFSLFGVTDPNTGIVSDPVFEFDTGAVLAPNGQFAAPASYGETITITDNSPTPITVVFEITDAPQNVTSPTNVPVVVNPGTSQVGFVNAVVAAINNQFQNTPFNARAVLSNGRVTLIGDTAVATSGPNAGFNVVGNYTVTPGAFRVPIEETFTSAEIIVALQNLINGVPGSTTNPPPGIPGLTMGAEGTRVNFLGALTGDFDSTDASPTTPRTPRFMFDQGSDGNVAAGSIAIPFLASDTGEDIVQTIIDVINNANPPLAGGLMAQGTNPPGRTVTFTAPAPNMAVVTQFSDPPFDTGAAAPGGNVTGLAFLPTQFGGGQFGLGRMFAVSDAGGFYEILAPDTVAPQNINGDALVPTDFITVINDPQTGAPIRFMGLSEGPPNLQGGAFANLFFGISNTGRIYAFNTLGELQPIFQDGSTFVDTGIFNANGLAFSTLDYNLWHRTVADPNDVFRHLDAGHGIEPTSTQSRIVRTLGGSSLYFGNALTDITANNNGLQTLNREGRTVTSLGQEVGTRVTYDFPGGAHGSTVSAPFSLQGYGAADQPTLYFNYFLETEGTDSLNQMRDSFRVFVSSDDSDLPSDPVFRNNLIQGQWYLLATNNAATIANRLVEADSPFEVQLVHDNTGGWRQARIDLSPFAGLENIRLRFDFSTAGSMDTPAFFSSNTGGEELRIISGAELRDGQTFVIDGTTFEFDLGPTLVAPTGDALRDGETFTIDDDSAGANPPVAFQFTNDNTFESNIRTRDGSFFRDGDTFTITDDNGVTRAFEFDSGFSLLVPTEGAQPADAAQRGIQDGDTFSIDSDGAGPNPPVVFEFDFRTGIAPTSNVAIDVITDVAILIPAAGGTPLVGVNDGDTFTIDSDGPGGNPPTVFEFDNNGALNDPTAVSVAYNSSDDQDTLATKTAAAINAAALPGVNAVNAGNGEVRLGTSAAPLDTSGSPTVQQRNLPGSQTQVADRIVQAIQNYQATVRDLGLTPIQTTRGGVPRGEVHLGGTAQHVLNTTGAPTLRERGAPGLNNPAAVAVPFVPSSEPPAEGFTEAEIAASITAAINQAHAAGFGVRAMQDATNPAAVLLLTDPAGGDFSFSPGSTALAPEGFIPIAFTNSQSADEVAAAIAAAIGNSPLNVTARLIGNRINLQDNDPTTPLIIQQTPGAGAALPSVRVEGGVGTAAGRVPVAIHSEMTVQQVRDVVAAALNASFAPATASQGINVFATHADVVRIQGHSIVNAGPLGASSFATRYVGSDSALPGDAIGAFNESPNGPALRALDNRHEGVFIDDIIIGFAERGEMVTGPNRGDDTFTYSGNAATVGAYQLEIRRASEYGVGQLSLVRSFDTNDRLSQDFTLFAPAGSEIKPTSTFFISDGVDTVTFEYVNQTLAGAQPQPGNVPIFFDPSDSAATVANKIRDTINSALVQQNRRLNVSAASINSSDRVDLVGETVLVNIIQPGLVIDSVTTDANALRDALLGPGITALGDAQLMGGTSSAGFFSGGTTSIGIERGIVLSTGDINFAEGPNASDGSTGLASQLGDADLDAEFGTATQDTTFLQFDFELDSDAGSDLFFNFVFASEEYNEFVNDIFNDVFAFFVDGQNIAVVPGTTDPISINTVNGGNPFGTAAANPQFYNNNDPSENGQFLTRFGLDGFTSVFTAVARDLAPGRHTIKLAISDVGDRLLDSAVFIEAGSFSSTPPGERRLDGIIGIRHDEIGDQNRHRDQGQLIIANNQIFDSAEWGIVVDSTRNTTTGMAAPGSVRNLEQLNQERLTPGVVIRNNVVARNGQGGLRFSGDAGGAGLPPAAVPFGRIINNTFYGNQAGDVGIQIDEFAGPTLMNNIVANFTTGINVDASSQPTTVIASTLYQNNATNSNVGLGTNFPVVLGPTDPLFVDPANNNFYLVAGSPAIDSSIDSIQERPSLRDVKASVNIPPSNVLAPERDALGQLRRDDPSFQPPFGAGQVVFKDRGAIDRVDFAGPTADLLVPRDNDAEGRDQNPSPFIVRTSGELVRQFVIKLLDGVEPIDPSQGTGIDASTVVSAAVHVDYFTTDDVNLQDPQRLVEFVDYTFAFNPLNDTITLTDVGGLFAPGFYRITLDNTPIDPNDPNDDGVDAIRDLAGNPLKPNRVTGETVLIIEIPEDLDFGDAPDSYGTTIDFDGPRHTIVPNFFLGTTVDAELDGQPSSNADGDGADEDGVRTAGRTLAGAGINVGANVSLEVFASAPGFLDAWIDFNRDGVFDESERIADSLPLNSAANNVNVAVPEVSPEDEATLLGSTYARFRFSSSGGLGPTGPAADGEVEDYQIVLKRSDSPWQNPNNNLDVNRDGLVTILDALLVVTDIRNNRDATGELVHDLTDPTQLFVVPGRPPFVDVNGDSLVSVADLQQIIAELRERANSANGEAAEGESLWEGLTAARSVWSDAGEGEADIDAIRSAAPTAPDTSARRDLGTGGADLSGPHRPADAASPQEDSLPSLRSTSLNNELVLANSRFQTYEFEAALDDIADDISDVWGRDGDDEEADLDGFFPFGDVAGAGQ